jgi:hypothetical protein
MGFEKEFIFLDFISFGKAMATNGSTDLPSGPHISAQG